MEREKARELLPIIQAIADGKFFTLQTPNGKGGWVDCKDVTVVDLLKYTYRIKPRILKDIMKPYRAYKDCDELVECWEKKMFVPAAMFTKDTRNRLYRPEIWVKNKNDYTERLIVTFGKNFVKVGSKSKPVSLDVLYTDYEFLDGTPCGVNLED